MKKHILIYSLIFGPLFLFVMSCGTAKQGVTTSFSSELDHLALLMTGEFSSAAQAKEDSSFYDIHLMMIPIWDKEAGAKWLYVEQAAIDYIRQPYRQRIYRLKATETGTFESRVYELPDPKKFIHAWEDPSLFETIHPDSLIIRKGCAVYLSKNGACYEGSTRNDECKSTLRGATYATSEVRVCANQILSWDRGWKQEGKQVWGAVKAGYRFDRLD